jgi:hypothetical protein
LVAISVQAEASAVCSCPFGIAKSNSNIPDMDKAWASIIQQESQLCRESRMPKWTQHRPGSRKLHIFIGSLLLMHGITGRVWNLLCLGFQVQDPVAVLPVILEYGENNVSSKSRSGSHWLSRCLLSSCSIVITGMSITSKGDKP